MKSGDYLAAHAGSSKMFKKMIQRLNKVQKVFTEINANKKTQWLVTGNFDYFKLKLMEKK